MEVLLASNCVSVTELKKSPTAIIEQAHGQPVAILNRNKPEAYLVPADTFAALMDWLEDVELAEIVRKRAGNKRVEVSIDDL